MMLSPGESHTLFRALAKPVKGDKFADATPSQGRFKTFIKIVGTPSGRAVYFSVVNTKYDEE